MKTLLLLAVSMMPIVSFASLCNDSLIAKSEQTFLKVKYEEEVGHSSRFEVLMSEKNLLELKQCQNSENLENFSDLARNINSRLSLVTQLFDSGMATSMDVNMLKNEKIMYKNNCNQLLESSKSKFSVGLITPDQLNSITVACESL